MMFGKVIGSAGPLEKGHRPMFFHLIWDPPLNGGWVYDKEGVMFLSPLRGERPGEGLNNIPLLDNLVTFENKLFDG